MAPQKVPDPAVSSGAAAPALATISPVRAALLAAVLSVGASLRIAWNDVPQYSPADETYYLSVTRWLAPAFIANYPAATRWYIETPGAQDSPPLLRFGHFALASAACKVAPRCDYRTLAWLSTLAGIAALVFTFLVARELFRAETALLAAALSVTSPLQLALGRRALQDEIVCAAILATLWAFLRALRAHPAESGPSRHLLAVVLATFALSLKETFFLFAPAFLVLWLLSLRGRGPMRRDALFLLPPVLYYLGNAMLERSFTDFFAMVRIASSSIGHAYALQYQSGPAHRYLFDLFLLAPIAFLLAVGAIALPKNAARDGEGAFALATFAGTALVAFSFFSCNLRYFSVGDALLRLLAAWFVLERAPRARALQWGGTALCASALTELWIFRRVFLERAVYDPTTYDLLRALDAIPRF